MYDVVIIGAGIIGSSIARALSKEEAKIIVLEMENDVANETTMANSAIIHSGYDPVPGTKKAKYNAWGNRLYEQLCKELNCMYQQIGSLTVAVNEEEWQTLNALKARAAQNNVEVFLLTKEEVLKREPNVSDACVGALYAPTAAIVYPWEVTIALMENAMENGVELALNTKVTDISRQTKSETHTDYYMIETSNGSYKARSVINCAGIFADQIHNMVGHKSFEIRPRRGQYFVLDKSVGSHVHHVIFPCPSEKGKGVLVTPTTHGNILVGPTSEEITDVFGTQTTREGLEFVREHANLIVKDIPYNKVIRSFAGLRPSSDRHDFIVEEVEGHQGFIDVAGIESPGLASAPAIAQDVSEIVIRRLGLQKKVDFNPNRREHIVFKDLSTEEKQALIKKNPLYGKMVCRCEQVTEGEIVDCIQRSAGARTIKGVKKRVRPGMGRCQGGFCEPLVLDILARELGVSPLDIDYDGVNTKILLEETKNGGETHVV